MKYLVTLALSLFLSGTAFSQFGLNATYRSNTAPDWQFVNFNEEEALLPASAIAFGVDYWIPLKTVRIDLLPELNFSKMSSTLDSRANTQLDNTWLSLYLNANIYFLNLEGDCDCPTFSKSGGVFDKGLFLQLSPGATWMRNEVSAEGQSQDSNDFAFSIAAGLGLDLGLLKITAVSLGQARGLAGASPELERSIAVLLDRPVREHLQIVELQHGHRDVLAGFREDAGHAHLLC